MGYRHNVQAAMEQLGVPRSEAATAPQEWVSALQTHAERVAEVQHVTNGYRDALAAAEQGGAAARQAHNKQEPGPRLGID